MKRSDLTFSFLLIPIDYLMVILAGVSAYYIRFADFTTDIRPIMFALPFNNYFSIILAVALLWIIIFVFTGMYSISGSKRLAQELHKVFIGCSMGLVLIVILIFFQRELFSSRFIVLVGWLLAIIYVSLGRIFIRWLQRKLYKIGYGVKKVVVIGAYKTADNLIHEFESKKNSGYKVVKRVRELNSDTWENLYLFIQENEVDEIIQADSNLNKTEVLKLYDLASENHISFKYAADLLGIKVLKTEVTEIAGVPVAEVKRTTLDGWGRIMKRVFDLIVSSILIILLSPIFILTAILIKIDSKGPVFFSKKDDGTHLSRVGEGGKSFNYFKFRSMIPYSDSMRYNELAKKNIRNDGPMVKIKDDPRVTKVGRVIRRWSIDELPELFLVFAGKMSLVGPRPHLPEEVAKYENHHKKSLTIKPGITGLAQISGRSDLLFEEEVKLDVYYIENWNLLLDLSILLKTPWAVIKSREAQ
ncbi:sugar transferase [Patescibacteria group bacterium]|nr:sugar transferase [Patescibacteria group bacterium]